MHTKTVQSKFIKVLFSVTYKLYIEYYKCLFLKKFIYLLSIRIQ